MSLIAAAPLVLAGCQDTETDHASYSAPQGGADQKDQKPGEQVTPVMDEVIPSEAGEQVTPVMDEVIVNEVVEHIAPAQEEVVPAKAVEEVTPEHAEVVSV